MFHKDDSRIFYWEVQGKGILSVKAEIDRALITYESSGHISVMEVHEKCIPGLVRFLAHEYGVFDLKKDLDNKNTDMLNKMWWV